MAAVAPANLFSVFPESLAVKLFANAKTVKLAADEVLFIAGDPGDGCYRVEQGLLKVSMIAPSGAERILAIVGSGGIVGELSTIDGLPRSASVAAVRDSELTFVSRATFQTFAEANPQVYIASRHAAGRTAARHRRAWSPPEASCRSRAAWRARCSISPRRSARTSARAAS